MRAIKKISAVLLTSLTIGLTSCSSTNSGQMVDIETPYGTMRALLYDDTPHHRDNFISLVKDGAYDSLLFHRIIRDCIIQGGDPNSRHATRDAHLGQTSLGDEINPEILFPTHYHKHGALAMARQPDKVNPKKKSSGSQFYIVTGQRQTDDALNEYETIRDNKLRQQIYLEILKFYEDSLSLLQNQGKAQELSDLQIRIIERVEILAKDRGFFRYPTDVRQDYAEHGGLPQLDGDYTVFGEIIEGLNILDSLNQVAVRPPSMRPAHDIWMKISLAN